MRSLLVCLPDTDGRREVWAHVRGFTLRNRVRVTHARGQLIKAEEWMVVAKPWAIDYDHSMSQATLEFGAMNEAERMIGQTLLAAKCWSWS